MASLIRSWSGAPFIVYWLIAPSSIATRAINEHCLCLRSFDDTCFAAKFSGVKNQLDWGPSYSMHGKISAEKFALRGNTWKWTVNCFVICIFVFVFIMYVFYVIMYVCMYVFYLYFICILFVLYFSTAQFHCIRTKIFKCSEIQSISFPLDKVLNGLAWLASLRWNPVHCRTR